MVCVELDPVRYRALLQGPHKRKGPLLYMLLARFQERMAAEFGTTAGGEMISAVEAAKGVGAKVAFMQTSDAVFRSPMQFGPTSRIP